jgi:transcriptional regulator with XRE-family HTH domain
VKSRTRKEVLKLLGQKVKELRLRAKMSQADVCYEADIDLSTLSRLERGLLNVTFDTLYAISKTLKVELKDFFDF